MIESEIALARAYLAVSGQDPVTALIRSVRDLERTRNLVSPGYVRGRLPGPNTAPVIEAGTGEITAGGCREATG